MQDVVRCVSGKPVKGQSTAGVMNMYFYVLPPAIYQVFTKQTQISVLIAVRWSQCRGLILGGSASLALLICSFSDMDCSTRARGHIR
jgi:hypothetical protein